MNPLIKNILGLAIILALLASGYVLWSFSRSYAKSIQPTSVRSFSVTAEGRTVAAPDIAQFNFEVITEGGKDVTKLQSENTEKVNRAIDFIKSHKVDPADIKTLQYNIEPRYQYSVCPAGGGVCPPPAIVGYVIRQTVLVKIRDFSKIGDLISGVTQNGANSISDLTFKIDDPTEVQNKAREEAIAKAKDKAKDLAKAGGFRIGRLISIEEGFTPPPMPYPVMRGLSKGAEAYAAEVPVIEPGSQEITVNVTLKYEIE